MGSWFRLLGRAATAMAAGLLLGTIVAETFDARKALQPQLNLLVVDVVAGFAPYTAFCHRNPADCDLSGPDVIVFDQETEHTVRLVNRMVNRQIGFMLDIEQYGEEEFWTYPRSGWGDCEDLALEKRARLVRQGLPRGALRLAIVLHRERLISHCVLTVESSAGTYVLDSFSDAVLPWFASPYYFEARERNDGRWERFDQGVWWFDYP